MALQESPALYQILREKMVSSQLRARGIADERVLTAMLKVPRHEFAPERYRDQAYSDHPLPIGEGQTISQPYIVATMLEALRLSPSNKVLEIGTGSGYVTALLAELTAEVISIERHASLAESASTLLETLGFQNVRIVVGDGWEGFPQMAPYHAIVVSAAAPVTPPALIAQLAEDGRMIIPVGNDEAQQLRLIRKQNGQLRVELREMCRFVPLVPSVSRRDL
jgi:protein-L-isoaspartate(D-aspartate) O-methyltransferase